MKVIFVEPNKPAYSGDIGNDLKSLQDYVGGLIECVYFLPDAVIICNEEGKLMQLPGCRRFGESVIAGKFIICGNYANGEEFDSLSEEQVQKYLHQFSKAQVISDEEVAADMKFEVTSL